MQSQTIAAPTQRLAHTIKQTQEILPLSRNRVYAEIRAGRLKVLKAGSRTLITAESIAAMLGGAK